MKKPIVHSPRSGDDSSGPDTPKHELDSQIARKGRKGKRKGRRVSKRKGSKRY